MNTNKFPQRTLRSIDLDSEYNKEGRGYRVTKWSKIYGFYKKIKKFINSLISTFQTPYFCCQSFFNDVRSIRFEAIHTSIRTVAQSCKSIAKFKQNLTFSIYIFWKMCNPKRKKIVYAENFFLYCKQENLTTLGGPGSLPSTPVIQYVGY